MALASKLLTLNDAVERHELIEAGEDLLTKFQWGVPFLQRELGPVAAGRTYVVAARPNVGKSLFALMVASVVDVPSLFVSLEDDLAELGKRSQQLPDRVRDRVLVATPFSPALSKIKSLIVEAHEHAGVRLVVVDYLNKIRYDGEYKAFNEAAEIGNTIAELSSLSKELDFALILCAQIGRPPPGARGDFKPQLWNLKGSGSIEQDAHTVVILDTVDEQTIEARIAKSKSTRRGGTQRYRHDPVSGFLHELTTEEQAEDEGDELFD
jgi:replicative DNA helicase